MATKIDQKAYLQKYLSGPSVDKKKKKKKVVKGNGLKIIDDDIDLTKLRPLEVDELDIYGEGEDAPQVAGIIDERPEEIRKLDKFKSATKWKVINQDDGFNSQVQVQEIKIDIEEVKNENEIIFGKMYSDSEDEEKNDSDPSPPRKQNKEIKTENNKKPQNNSESDFSPPRRHENQKTTPPRTNEKSDSSSRKHESRKERVRKPSRWGDSEDSKSDRNHSGSQKNRSPKRRELKREKSSDSDISPPRKSRRNDDSDVSPPHKSRKETRRKSDSDASPPRKKQTKNRRRNNSSDSDLSPPRKNKPYSNRDRNQGSSKSWRKQESDSDQSPPRKRNEKSHRRDCSSPPPTSKKMEKTLEGKLAGLQDARQLRKENNDFREREEQAFKRMTDDVSGRNAKAVSRKSKRDTSAERQKQIEKAERQKLIDEKYKKWSKGIKQQQDQEDRAQEFLHEASKPLARYKDDTDLEGQLKDIERDGDPMLKYMRERKRERGELGPEKPSYKGNFPPNRFNIKPGYRWDGVDRSNGYEKKYFDQQSKRKAQEEEAYKWSTEDL